MEDDILANFIRLISTTPELHAYTVNKLYHAVKEDVSQEALMYSAVWAIGEFGDVLVRGEGLDPEETHVKVLFCFVFLIFFCVSLNKRRCIFG